MSHEPASGFSNEPVERLAGDAVVNERWRSVLSGDASLAPASHPRRALFRHLPSEPRCKWCYAPYGAPFGPIVRRLGYGPWSKTPTLCGRCLTEMERNQASEAIAAFLRRYGARLGRSRWGQDGRVR